MGFTNEDKILIKILHQEKRYGAKKLLREFVCIVLAMSIFDDALEEWRLFDQQIIDREIKQAIKHVFDHVFVNTEDTLSISCDKISLATRS